MRITAAVLDASGLARPYAASAPLRIADMELSAARPGELLVEILAAGLCHSDLSVVNGDRPRPTPMVLGHEAAAKVIEVGSPDSAFAVGDHVVLAFLPACGACAECQSGRGYLCAPAAAANGQGRLLRGGYRLRGRRPRLPPSPRRLGLRQPCGDRRALGREDRRRHPAQHRRPVRLRRADRRRRGGQHRRGPARRERRGLRPGRRRVCPRSWARWRRAGSQSWPSIRWRTNAPWRWSWAPTQAFEPSQAEAAIKALARRRRRRRDRDRREGGGAGDPPTRRRGAAAGS